jgi:hypothetical protein
MVPSYAAKANKEITMTIEEVLQNYDKADIKKVYVKGGYDVYFPVIGDDGKPHLQKIHIKVDK